MREFLNAILAAIMTTSLTDIEFDTVSPDLNYGYNIETYGALLTILKSRDLVSNDIERLGAYFFVKGVTVSNEPNPQATSKILIGAVL